MGRSVEYAFDHLQYLNGKLQKENINELQYVKPVQKAKIYVKRVFVIYNSDCHYKSEIVDVVKEENNYQMQILQHLKQKYYPNHHHPQRHHLKQQKRIILWSYHQQLSSSNQKNRIDYKKQQNSSYVMLLCLKIRKHKLILFQNILLRLLIQILNFYLNLRSINYIDFKQIYISNIFDHFIIQYYQIIYLSMSGHPKLHNTFTTSTGQPVDDNQNSLSAGQYGPLLISDFHLIDKLAHFDRERIPQRVVHAKGTGAHGVFKVTHDVTPFTKAKVFESLGKETPVFIRWSTVAGEKGSADTARDPRGFAIKFYTQEGNWDMTGNNTPVFFIRDPIKFPDFIHSQKRNPQTNLPDANMAWDFWSYSPESTHQVSILFSDRGTPDGFRFMNGYSSHTFRWVNKQGTAYWIKLHFKSKQGIKCLSTQKAGELVGQDPDYAQRDLFNHLNQGKTAEWDLKIQVIPQSQGYKYRFNIFDVTKIVHHKDYPQIPVGTLIINRNVENYFAQTQQAAFSPGHLVPGMQPSPDKMLQGRLFSYPDTHRHRLGANYQQIPINCPYRAKVNNGQRDGPMRVDSNQGKKPNYEPNTFKNFSFSEDARYSPYRITGLVARHKPNHPNCDFQQPGILYRTIIDQSHRTRLRQNIAGHMKPTLRHIQENAIKNFLKCDPEYGDGIGKILGFPSLKSRL